MKFLAAKTVLAAAITFGALVQTAHAGIPVIDGGNLTQNILTAIESVAQTLKQAEEYAKQVEQYKTQLEEYETQIDQYENQIQNTNPAEYFYWDQASETINRLIAAQDMLSYYQNRAGSLDAYLAKFQDADYYRGTPCFNGGSCTPAARATMAENRRISNQAQQKANAAQFKAIDQQQQNLRADAYQLRSLQGAASSADGQMKAIQYATQFAGHQSNQLLQIRGLMLAQQNALLAQQQELQNQKAIELAAGEYSRSRTDVQKSPEVEW